MLSNIWLVSFLTLTSLQTCLSKIIADQDSPKYRVLFTRTYNQTYDDALSLVDEYPMNYDILRKNGKEYICSIDSLESFNLTEEDQSFLSLEEKKNEAIKIIRDIHSQNSPHLNQGMMPHIVSGEFGYWTYVMSYNSSIVQLHATRIKGKNEPLLIRYTLGTIAPNAFDIPSDFSLIASQDGSRYLTQNVYGGSICDLTGRPRSVTLKYVCSPDQKFTIIEDIMEPLTCNYLLTVAMPELCSSEIFRPKAATSVNNVTCDALRYEIDEYRTPIHSVDILDYDLKPLGHGIFLGSLKENPKKFANVFFTNRFSHASLDIDELLQDLTMAWIYSIINRKITSPRLSFKGAPQVLKPSDRHKYVSYVYGFNGEELLKVSISNPEDDPNLIIVTVTDQLIIENFVELYGETMDINYLKAQDIINEQEGDNSEIYDFNDDDTQE